MGIRKVDRSDILTIQLNLLDIFTEADHWLGTRDLQTCLDLRGLPANIRLIQKYLQMFVDMGLIVRHPDDLTNFRFRKSGTIAVLWSQ